MWQGKPEQGVSAIRAALEHVRLGPAQWMIGGIRLGTLGTAAAADVVTRARQRHDNDAVSAAVADGLEFYEHARDTARFGRPRSAMDPFTPRERAVLGLVAQGGTNRQAGGELFISEKTVSVHLTRIMAKLGATNGAEAVAIAYERGLLEQPTP